MAALANQAANNAESIFYAASRRQPKPEGPGHSPFDVVRRAVTGYVHDATSMAAEFERRAEEIDAEMAADGDLTLVEFEAEWDAAQRQLKSRLKQVKATLTVAESVVRSTRLVKHLAAIDDGPIADLVLKLDDVRRRIDRLLPQLDLGVAKRLRELGKASDELRADLLEL